MVLPRVVSYRNRKPFATQQVATSASAFCNPIYGFRCSLALGCVGKTSRSFKIGEDRFYRVSQKKRPAFGRLLLPDYISNDVLQYLIK